MPRRPNQKNDTHVTSDDVIAFVAQVSNNLHRAPSLNEIALHLGVSKTAADRKVRELIRQGILERAAQPLARANGVPGIRIRITAPAPVRASRRMSG
jgi:predicted transcriptional regulator